MAAELYLIRHAQASFMAEHYDRLSEIGQRQALILGHYLASYYKEFDVVWMGSLERHQKTFQGIQQSYYEQNKSLKEAILLPELNEHQAAEIHQKHLPELLQKPEHSTLRKLAEEKGRHHPELKKEFLRLFFQRTHLWAEGKIHLEGFESFGDFKKRVQNAYHFLLEAMEQYQSALIVSSGGTIAMLLGIMLGLSEQKVIELNWQIRNCSVSEFSHSKGKFYLRGFNQVAHFEINTPELVTYV